MMNYEIEKLKELLSEKGSRFQKFDNVIVRKLVEYIRVMKDGKIIIMLKGGIRVEETIK